MLLSDISHFYVIVGDGSILLRSLSNLPFCCFQVHIEKHKTKTCTSSTVLLVGWFYNLQMNFMSFIISKTKRHGA